MPLNPGRGGAPLNGGPPGMTGLLNVSNADLLRSAHLRSNSLRGQPSAGPSPGNGADGRSDADGRNGADERNGADWRHGVEGRNGDDGRNSVGATRGMANGNGVSDQHGQWLLVDRRRQRPPDIRGKKGNLNHAFKGALPLTDIYIGGCDKTCTENDLKDYCTNAIKVNVHKCAPLTTRSEYTKCFRIKVDVLSKEKIMLPDMWPENIIIRKYYWPRNNNFNHENVL